MKIQNVIFDFGGVLIDWNPKYLYRNVFETEEEMNFFLENVCRYDWNLLQDAGRSLSEATLILQKEHPKYSEEIAYYYGRWEEMLGGTIDENVKLIKPLKKRYKLYGLTNWSAETLPIAMEKYIFFKDLDGVVVSGDEKIIKPDPEIYEVLLNRYSIDAESSLFIDDNADNILTAKKMGFKTVHFTDKVNLEQLLKSENILL
ncbi:MAG TPA: HAD family phosphatase [Bacteroidales bacterium]|nr:HAD family phosphatase [Bacteroidales bacterium]